MTNGEKMISAFPNGELRKVGKGVVFSTGGWCHAYADEWWNAECEEPTTKNDLPHCQHTDEEIAKSFIEDVEAVKDQLPCGEQMDFPNTFEEFAKDYGFKDKDEVYTNGSELIPVFRVKQWLEHISTTKNDLALIHTEGLDEEIRCTMCTNHMKSDRGCDGSCVVNKDMYKAVMDAIEKRIQPTTKNDLGVDCISREQAIDAFSDLLPNIGYNKKAITEILQEVPSVTPQEPKTGHWVLTDVEGCKVWHCNCSECGKDPQDYIGGSENWWLIKNNLPKFCPNCGSRNEVEK